jgi:hypothetical protein
VDAFLWMMLGFFLHMIITTILISDTKYPPSSLRASWEDSFKQKLSIIETDTAELAESSNRFFVTPNDFTPRYHQVMTHNEGEKMRKTHGRIPPVTPVYNNATVVIQASWFHKQKICKRTCCVENVAISLDQDDTRIKSSNDGKELADVFEMGHPFPKHLHLKDFHGTAVSLDILPCLQPRTILHIDNYSGTLTRWFTEHRPFINVPYVLITSDTDARSPDRIYRDKLSNNPLKQDPLLIKWYGNNPDTRYVEQLDKFVPFPLGLSKKLDQMPHLMHYLERTNFSNPFAGMANKNHWIQSTELQNAVETTNILFVKFGINKHSQHRKVPFSLACDHITGRRNLVQPITTVSCSLTNYSIPDTYYAASQYLFGLSPRGNGWDCYRHYEYWLLGLIPIIEKRNDTMMPTMLQDLPYIEIDSWSNYDQETIIQVMKNYIASDEFQNNNFAGWERLFLRYWRRKILTDAGRSKDVVKDEYGREYYLGWKYSVYESPIVENMGARISEGP